MVEFLPLDALGAGGKKYGKTRGDLALEPVAASGYSARHMSIAGTLPALEITGTMTKGGLGSSEMATPKLVMAGYGGGQGLLTLPSLTMASSATAAETGQLVADLPAMTMTGEVSVGVVGGLGLTLPSLTMLGYGAGTLAGALPSLTLAGSGVTEEVGSLTGVLPALAMTGNGFLYSEVGRLVLTLPALQMAPSASLVLTLPALQMYAEQSVTVSEGWLLNARNGAVTRVDCWPFTQFARSGGKTFAVGPEGLYVLGGDTVDGEPIQWEFETGLSDLGSPAIKHIPYLYMDGIIDGEIEVTLIDDRGREYRYKYLADMGAIHAPHRRKLGNAIRTRNVAFRIASPMGAYAEFDALEPEVNLTQRSLG